MLSDEFKQAIKIISETLNAQNLDYALIASSNLALQGMDFSPNDLDIVMKALDLKKVHELFKEYSPSGVNKLKPDSKDPAWTKRLKEHPKWDVNFNLGEVPVQILGEHDDGEYVSKLLAKRLVYIDVDGVKVTCFSLEAEAEVYQETSRFEKAKKIRDFLASRNG
jgi:hypothetical protein